ncbi:glutamine--fructose-6-phosphate aminotransferase [isomerizing] [Endomicrobiia bacterium]|nr:glutamine--fructose-6-phosphate aminotransferase [isomerizing] [Endomicrobiia bacterium]GHT12703.1 glutamine--fructose-6-phosphate aminotransferase [isomerizing] [Endomicrobiia bacterium]GHT20142.1 glutamine--fructose-6-phosphate aminotransferase [isomerizing] [Endomicrobiia bacterium]GHT27761.1 glutamine--fructose-6-phosphate aminotransferase [isomerizing] [Endomicrobiia bacterium]GHT30371.1 glutamine--fructose-6-phosphate aminotransferase [isomerizing] [Endomicrobiia bacterium]
MCGIFGYIGKKNAVDIIFKGLEKLEYRGYDSAGIAVVIDKELCIRRSVGKLCNLGLSLKENPISANIGIGHTRWATHGSPSKENAHPHTDTAKTVVIVHNGIIENYVELKAELQKDGYEFKSETDTEVIAHLIKKYCKGNLFCAVQKTLSRVKGSYALGIVSKDESDKIICARKDASLIIGVGVGENFMASDIPALLPYTRDMIFLENGDIAEITTEKVVVKNIKGDIINREIKNIRWDTVQAEKDGYKHFMLKEIFEQPRTIEDTFRGRIYPDEGRVYIEEVKLKEEYIKNISNIYIVACGTSYHSGLVSKFLFESFAKIPTEVDIASEFKYRDVILDEKTLVVVISQSGETADTLAALRLAKSKGCQTLAVCNVVGSSISREAMYVIYTHCGPEIGVASTKAFTGQVTALYVLALDWAYKREALTIKELKKYLKELWEIPLKINEFLKNAESVHDIAKVFANKRDFLYLGRHINYPVALEGALKIKEISYIHAEGYAAGEMKHGPIALIDKSMPIVAIVIKGRIYEKIISNIEEAKARGGTIIAVADQSDKEIGNKSNYVIYVPETDEFVSPLMTVIPLQLLAYYISLILGCDVDQPRNLAKSVTVE